MPSVQLNSTCFLLEKKEKKVGGQRHYQMPSKQSCASTQVENRLSIFSKALPTKRVQWQMGHHHSIRYTALQQKLKPQLKLLFMENKQQMWQQQRSGLGKSLRWTLCSRTQTIILRSQQLSTGKK